VLRCEIERHISDFHNAVQNIAIGIRKKQRFSMISRNSGYYFLCPSNLQTKRCGLSKWGTSATGTGR
jgi:hypothetical protein